MHLRRALLLFAIVLGLAAIAASVSRPPEENAATDTEQAVPPQADTETAPTATPGADTGLPRVELTFDASDPSAQRMWAGQAATLVVAVDEPGQAEIGGLGTSADAQPLTPARFEVLPSAPGRYPIYFTPAAGDEQSKAGTLVVKPAPE